MRISLDEITRLEEIAYQIRRLSSVEGSDATLIGTSMMTSACLEAAEILARDRIWVEVLHCGSVKPIGARLIVVSARKTGAVVTAENVSFVGGPGSAVAKMLSERVPAVLRRIGVQDRFIPSGSIRELLADHRMRPEDIAAAAREAIEAKGV